MARLSDRDSSFHLEFTPIPPSADGPQDAYRVAFYDTGQLLLEKRFSVAEKQMGHYAVRKFARAFQYAPRLLNRNVGFGIGDSDDPDFYEPAAINAHADWIRVLVWSDTIDIAARLGQPPASGKIESWIYADIYLEEETGDVETSFVTYRALPLFCCDPVEAERFGEQLLSEIRVAARLRRALGLQAPNDLEEDDYAE